MRRPRRDAGAVLAIALLTGALLVFALLYQREAALRSGVQLTNALSRLIAEQTTRTFQALDQRLQLSGTRLQALGDIPGADPASVGDVLRDELRDMPYMRSMWLVDASGILLQDSGGIEARGTVVRDRAHFQLYLDQPATGFSIGRPFRSDVTGDWMLTVARPVRDGSGRLQYLVVGAIEPRYFQELWQSIDLGTAGAVALLHRSGYLLASSSAGDSVIGADISHLPLFTQDLLRSPEGAYIRAGVQDGVRRLVDYRQLQTYPELVVTVGAGYEEALGPWRRFALLTGAVWAASVAVAVILTLKLRRQARNREASDMRFRRMTQVVPQIVFIAGPDGAVRFVSQRWTEATGRPGEEALGMRWLGAVHPEDRKRMRKPLAEAMAAGKDLQFEHRLLHRDGGYRWQLLRAVPVQEDHMHAVSWFGTATDIDAMKRAQERLREQAEQLRMAGRLTRVGSWRMEIPQQRVTLSEEVAAVLDLHPQAQPALQELVAMLTPESAAKGLPIIQRSVEEGMPFDLELEMLTPTGRTVWIRTLGEPIRDEAGRVVCVQGAQQDITLRVLMMKEIHRLNASLEDRIAQRTGELSRQEALFRTLAEHAPLPFWTMDPRGNITFLSRAWYELVGGAPPQWLGQEWLLTIHPDDVTAMQHTWVRAVVSREPYTGTRRIRAQDGSYHTTTYRAVPVRDARGGVLFWVGVDNDITDLMANEAALRLANRQLEAFSYSVSHDLQSPLQRIASFARLLEQELAGAAPGRAQHYLARIQANADTMSQLIEGLLALASVSEVDLIRAPVNVSELAQDILQRLHVEQPQRDVQWHVQPGLAVLADARLMRSVMENLLGNAWKFTAGRETACIEVRGSQATGEYLVRDNGCGFDMAYADRLFTTFQRLHGADEFPGTGIGLATVARAISRQGGRVWAESQVGQGASFHFSLPAA